jgi:hypothetical protein
MSVLQKALTAEGIQLERDVPKGLHKNGKAADVWGRVVAAIRAAEAFETDKRLEREEAYNVLLLEKQSLQDENVRLKAALAQARVRDWAAGVPSLTVNDKSKLLEAAELKT